MDAMLRSVSFDPAFAVGEFNDIFHDTIGPCGADGHLKACTFGHDHRPIEWLRQVIWCGFGWRHERGAIRASPTMCRRLCMMPRRMVFETSNHFAVQCLHCCVPRFDKSVDVRIWAVDGAEVWLYSIL
jgi:hypothetical protein